jgi:hypothetical protein
VPSSAGWVATFVATISRLLRSRRPRARAPR